MSKTRKIKIAIGIVAFVLIMAVIAWIVALALLDSDVKTEVYGTEFDYVDDTMYDNAYIGMSGGKWQLYRGGSSISRAFGSLEYVDDGGYFAFINTDGKGWGYVDTTGSVIVEFNQEYQSLLPAGMTTLVGVRQNGEEFSVKNGNNRTHRGKGTIIPYSDFEAFYNAYGDKYVLFLSEKGYVALNTADYTEKSVDEFFQKKATCVGGYGYLSIDLDGSAVTLDSDLKKVNYLDGLLPKDSAVGDSYYEVICSRAVAYKTEGENRTCRLSDGKSFEVGENERAILTDGNAAVTYDGNAYRYFDGSSVRNVTFLSETEITGGGVHAFADGSEVIVFDDGGRPVKSDEEPSVEDVYRTKEKNRAQYTLDLEYLRIGSDLYGYENGALKKMLSGVESVVSNAKRDSSRIVTRQNGEIVIYDSFFKQTYRKEVGADAVVIDAFLPVTQSGLKVTMPRGEFEAAQGARVSIGYCTDADNYYAVETVGETHRLYAKNGSKAGEISLQDGERAVFSQSQIAVCKSGMINVVTKNKVLNVDYDEIIFSDNNKYAVAVRKGGLSVVNLNDATVTDERFISGGVEIVDKGENTFVLKNVKTGLYGIIDGGKMTLSPTYKFLELHDDFVIASVDDGNSATYFQADFSGKRLGKTYYALESTEGLTMGMNELGSMEIMNARGRVILKDVTFVPQTSNGFDFMKCKIYDEETKQTVIAVRNDNSLLVVTAGGYKRVISISHEG